MRFLLGCSLLLLGSIAGATEAPPPSEVARLSSLGRLFGATRFLHPHLAWQPVDWDRAVIEAIPAVRAATTRTAYRAAIARLLSSLRDPDTRVREVSALSAPSGGEPLSVLGDDQVLVARLRSLRTEAERSALAAAVLRARAVVLDLRVVSDFEVEQMEEAFAEIETTLTNRAAPPVRRRHLQHIGYSQDFATASFVTDPGAPLPAPAKPSARRLVLLANRDGTLSEPMLTLLADRQAQLVVDGDACGVPLKALEVPLGEGLAACVSVEEIADGRTIPATRVARAKEGDAALARALSLVRGAAPRRVGAAPLPLGGLSPERPYPERKLPSVEHRLLALFRYFNIVRWFDPHTELFDRPWDGQLAAFVPRMIAAETERDYVLALAELATYTDDSHAFVQSPLIWSLKGEAAPPVATSLVEGQLAILACLEEALCRSAGVSAGDVVVSIDGAPAKERFAWLRTYTTGSNPARRDQVAALHLLWGPDGSTVRLELRDGQGRVKTASLIRAAKNQDKCLQLDSPGDVYRILPGNIGYIDLKRLQLEDIEAALGKIQGTPATILDLRGYPRGRIWDLPGRFNTRDARVAVLLRHPTLGALSAADPMAAAPRLEQAQPVPPVAGARYPGKTIMLVDWRTQSQAEHLAMHFEAASDTTLVGSRTSGADGAMILFPLPGGVLAGVTGTEVRHFDGRPMQRIGLVPSIEAQPTLAGLRAGRDEVLERALEHAVKP